MKSLKITVSFGEPLEVLTGSSQNPRIRYVREQCKKKGLKGIPQLIERIAKVTGEDEGVLRRSFYSWSKGVVKKNPRNNLFEAMAEIFEVKVEEIISLSAPLKKRGRPAITPPSGTISSAIPKSFILDSTENVTELLRGFSGKTSGDLLFELAVFVHKKELRKQLLG